MKKGFKISLSVKLFASLFVGFTIVLVYNYYDFSSSYLIEEIDFFEYISLNIFNCMILLLFFIVLFFTLDLLIINPINKAIFFDQHKSTLLKYLPASFYDETDVIKSEMMLQNEQWKALDGFIHGLVSKDYSIEIPEEFRDNGISQRLQKLKEVIHEFELRDAKYLKNENLQQWISEGLGKMGVFLANYNYDVNDFSNVVLSELVHYIDASAGAIYFKNTNGEVHALSVLTNERFLQSNASFLLGEGLIGRCLLENRLISITDISEAQVKLVSGLGSSKPKHILYIPLRINALPFGVLEVASFKLIPDNTILFLERFSDGLALSIYSRLHN